MARPRFKPRSDHRKLVRTMAAYGTPQDAIARCVGLRSPKTLRRHFREELDRAAPEANAQVAQCLYQLATSGKHASATIFWLKVRAGWREQATITPPPVTVPPLVIQVYNDEAA